MKTLVFATNNAHKIAEVKAMLGDQYDFLSLSDIGCHEDIPETSPTIPGNAIQKARYVKDKYGYDCFSEDTGLEIDALTGAPGVLSARYAGPARDSKANMAKVLSELADKSDRGAQFRTVIALIMDGDTQLFEGIVRGHITTAPVGEGGFGYDPIFIPEGYDRTFAQMSAATKNSISHRARAIRKLRAFLKKPH
ncbi:MAG: non-canonical purine NTP diphosphatase [Bacteroidetes bacterium]|nr:MAG: non-canonical purine NTP diphosphatase [Bacteroidota bacterium]